MKITRIEALRIAARAAMDPRTVLSVYEGQPTTESSRVRVRDAALALGMPLPIVAASDGERRE